MYIKQEYTFWKIAHDLVVVQGFDILHLNSQTHELWLEKDYKWKTHVVRLKVAQFNWARELLEDIHRTYQRVKQNKRLFTGSRLTFHNLYLTEYLPVDDWEKAVKDLLKSDSSVNMNLYYLDEEYRSKESSRFYHSMSLNSPQLGQNLQPAEMESIISYLRQQIVSSDQQRKRAALDLFKYGKPIMTYVLLVLNILAFCFVEWKGKSTSLISLIQYGAKYNPALMDGEWWRIVTSMFLHIGFLHLFMNMLALFYLGTAVERIYGSLRFTGIYFLAGIFGGLSSFMMNPQIAAGASGAIFGLFGALLFFGLRHKRLFFRTMGTNVLFIIGLNLAFGFIVPQVDNSAHLGGLTGGFIASMLIHLPKQKNLKVQLLSLAIYILAAIGMVWGGTAQYSQSEQAGVQVQYTQELIKDQQYDQVIHTATNALKFPGSYEAELLFNRSYAYTQKGKLDKAKQDLEKAVQVKPDMAEAHFNLALIYQKKGRLNQAKEEAEKAASLKPGQEDFQQLLRSLN